MQQHALVIVDAVSHQVGMDNGHAAMANPVYAKHMIDMCDRNPSFLDRSDFNDLYLAAHMTILGNGRASAA